MVKAIAAKIAIGISSPCRASVGGCRVIQAPPLLAHQAARAHEQNHHGDDVDIDLLDGRILGRERQRHAEQQGGDDRTGDRAHAADDHDEERRHELGHA